MSAPNTQAGQDPASPDLYATVSTTVTHAEQLNQMLRDHAVVVHNTTSTPALAAHSIPGETR